MSREAKIRVISAFSRALTILRSSLSDEELPIIAGAFAVTSALNSGIVSDKTWNEMMDAADEYMVMLGFERV